MVRLLNSSAAFLFAFLSAFPTAGQAAPKPAPQTVQAELNTTIKAKTTKPGDAISARTVTPLILAPGQVIPVGSTLRGHVRQVEFASEKPHASLLAISFEQAEIAKGHVLPLNLTVEAVMMPSAAASQNNGMQKLASPSSGPLPNDQPLHGSAYKLSDTTSEITQNPNSLGHEGITNTTPSGTGAWRRRSPGGALGVCDRIGGRDIGSR